MENRTSQWHVYVWGTKFKHELNPKGFHHEEQWFSSKQAAEDYAKRLFGIEKWEVKEHRFTEEEAQQNEEVRQIMAHWKAQLNIR